MAPLLIAFIAAALAQLGDTSQLLVVAFVAETGRVRTVIAALAATAVLSSLVGAAAGLLFHQFLTLKAAALLVAVALAYSGATALIQPPAPHAVAKGRTPLLLASLLALLGAEMVGKTQFLTAGLVAQSGSFGLTAAGAAAGMIVVNLPAAALGSEFARTVPVRVIRFASAPLFLLAAAILAINALGLA